MTFTIREAKANENDFMGLVELIVKHFAKEHEMGALSGKTELDADKVVREVAAVLGCKAWIAEDEDNKIVGSLGLTKGASWYTSKEQYADRWFYVLPEWRKKGVATALLKQVKEFAKNAEHPVMLGIHNMEDVERKIKFFQRAGLKLAGGIFYVGE